LAARQASPQERQLRTPAPLRYPCDLHRGPARQARKAAPMAVSLSSHRRSDIVARLRAAGCVFAEDEARLLISEARTPAELTAMVDRRTAGLPLEHVIGWAEFCGLRIAVDPGVFVPRRRTEFLVSEAVSLAGAAT